jgi:hypothetical protein
LAYFKYMAFERFASLRAGRIRFTQPGAFNDPFEMPAFKAAEAEAIRLRGLAGLTRQTGEIMGGLTEGRVPQAAFIPPIFYWWGLPAAAPAKPPPVPSEASIERLKRIDAEFGILSLAMTADNLLLWAHYADEHRGLAVEIDPDDAAFNRHARQGAEFQLARPVRYNAERPQIPETDEILFEHFFAKSPHWAYEQEYRIVRHLADAVQEIDAGPAPVHLFELPPSAIRRVIFGARVRPEQRAAVAAATRAIPALAHVGFAEAAIDPAKFKLEIRAFDPAVQKLEDAMAAALAQAQAAIAEVAAAKPTKRKPRHGPRV